MPPPTSLQNFNVLIADDEPLMRKLVLNVLTSLGFTKITIATSGRKAIEEVANNHFDFIITDWRMGDMDGIDLLRHLRASVMPHKRRMPVIMLTGNTETHYVKTAISEGVNAYLIKPFSAAELVRRIRSIIEHPRDFITGRRYTGPDRRHDSKPPPEGVDRRKKGRKK